MLGALLFVALELSARLYLFGSAALSFEQMNSLRALTQTGFLRPARDPRLGFELKPDLDAIFKFVPFRTNHDGLRDRDYALHKAAGTYRVAVLGSSFALPAGVAIEDAFHSLLEERFAGSEFINFAVGMYSPEQVLAALEVRALPYEPDLVLVTATRLAMPWLIHAPDSEEGRQLRRIDPDALPSFGPSYPVLQSFLIQLLRQRTGRLPAPGAAPAGLERLYLALEQRVSGPEPPPLAQAVPPTPRGSVLERLARVGEAHSLPIVLVLLEFEDRPRLPVDEQVARRASELGIRYLDTRDAFRGTRASDFWIHELDPHPNAAAHERFAEVVGTFLRDEALLPEPRG